MKVKDLYYDESELKQIDLRGIFASTNLIMTLERLKIEQQPKRESYNDGEQNVRNS